MTYLNYCKRILLYLFILCSTFVLIVLLQIGIKTSGQALWVNELYAIKSNISSSIQKPKLAVISGSNSLFGISCEMIHTQTEVDCLNGATHAGLGIKYILDRAHSFLKPGDTVLLPLEYAHYRSNNIPGKLLVNYVLEHNPKYLISTDIAHSIRIITGVSFNKIIGKFSYKFNPPATLKTPYSSNNINEFGDETGNIKSQRSEKQLKNLVDLKPDRNISGEVKNNPGLQTIKEFLAWCSDSNIKVMATWPNTVWFDTYKGKEQQAFFESINKFYEELNVPMLGNPEDYMYDKSMFYDTRYHLNDVGVRLRTQQLIDLLEPEIKDLKI